MDSDLYKLVTAAVVRFGAPAKRVADAVLSLLASAQSKNQRLNITGALLSYGGIFAQVLEGPRNSVEQLFARIQLDERNSEVTVALRWRRSRARFS
jgi:hypothetical protein